MLITTIVTGTWPSADGSDANGTVDFDLGKLLTDNVDLVSVLPKLSTVQLNAGSIAWGLVANDSPDVIPPNSQYWVTEKIVGAPVLSYWITVPSVPPNAREVSDGVGVLNSPVLTSATADFTNADVGKFVFCTAFGVGSTIVSVTNSTTAVLSNISSLSTGGLTVVVGASVDLSVLRPT